MGVVQSKKPHGFCCVVSFQGPRGSHFDGLLDGLSAQQLRDLFAYLRIKQPISR